MQYIYLIRHAKTEANKSGMLCGKTETELIESVEDIKFKLISKIGDLENALVISSPLKRARVTASVFDKDVIVEPGFCEFDFGDFDGKTFDYIKNSYPDEFEKLLKEGNNYQYPNGENIKSFLSRISKTYLESIEKYKDQENIVIVSHSGVIQILLSYILTGNESLYWNFKIENCCVVKLYYCENTPVIEYIK